MSDATRVLSTWDEIWAAGAAEVGGKAWALARMARYRLPVPPGIVITASAQADRTSADALRETIRMQGWQQTPLAVRSSAVGEDTHQASFAGIHHTALNVIGQEALLRTVQEVWASLSAEPALAYRQRLGLPLSGAAMPVLVMPMISARCAGIAFTADPASGREDRVVIHANWGLGESLVNGQAEGDVFTLATAPQDERPRLIDQKLGRKQIATLPHPDGGTTSSATPIPQAAAATLTQAQAEDLARLTLLTATALDPANTAFDLEWAHDGERFWLLQARPITVRARYTYPGLRAQPTYWSRGNVKEVMPFPLAPAEWSGLRPLIDLLLESGMRLGGYPTLPGLRRGKLHRGHGYLDLSVMQWEAWDAFDLAPEAMNAMIGGEQPAIEVAPATRRERLQRGLAMARYALRSLGLRRRGRREVAQALQYATRVLGDPDTPSPVSGPAPSPSSAAGSGPGSPATSTPTPEPAPGAKDLRAHFDHICAQAGLHFLQGAGGASLTTLIKLLDQHLPGRGHALASALMVGGPPSVTAQQSFDLLRLADLARADPQAWAWLEARPSLPEDQRDDWRRLPPDSGFRSAFAAFLARYGHRGVYESYLRNPRWRERPGYLLDQLQPMSQTSLMARRAGQQAQREQARRTVSRALPWWSGPIVSDLIRRAQHESNDREAARSGLMAYLAVSRQLLLCTGQRAVTEGWLDAPEDVFWLDHTETLAVLEGVLPGTGLRERVADRRAQMAAWEAEPPQEVLVEHADPSHRPAAHASPSAPVPGQDTLRGVAVGTGLAEGIARRVHSPQQALHLREGEILVAASTDPAWTPLFLRVGGLVVETGGALSHAAIVAREFGIPAVVNVAGAMSRIREGERVRVDGLTGLVTKLDAA